MSKTYQGQNRRTLKIIRDDDRLDARVLHQRMTRLVNCRSHEQDQNYSVLRLGTLGSSSQKWKYPNLEIYHQQRVMVGLSRAHRCSAASQRH